MFITLFFCLALGLICGEFEDLPHLSLHFEDLPFFILTLMICHYFVKNLRICPFYLILDYTIDWMTKMPLLPKPVQIRCFLLCSFAADAFIEIICS